MASHRRRPSTDLARSTAKFAKGPVFFPAPGAAVEDFAVHSEALATAIALLDMKHGVPKRANDPVPYRENPTAVPQCITPPQYHRLHGDTPPPSAPERRLECQHCGRRFMSAGWLRAHTRTHHAAAAAAAATTRQSKSYLTSISLASRKPTPAMMYTIVVPTAGGVSGRQLAPARLVNSATEPTDGLRPEKRARLLDAFNADGVKKDEDGLARAEQTAAVGPRQPTASCAPLSNVSIGDGAAASAAAVAASLTALSEPAAFSVFTMTPSRASSPGTQPQVGVDTVGGSRCRAVWIFKLVATGRNAVVGTLQADSWQLHELAVPFLKILWYPLSLLRVGTVGASTPTDKFVSFFPTRVTAE